MQLMSACSIECILHNLHCSLFLPMMRLDLMFVADGGDDDADRALFVGFISYIR